MEWPEEGGPHPTPTKDEQAKLQNNFLVHKGKDFRPVGIKQIEACALSLP